MAATFGEHSDPTRPSEPGRSRLARRLLAILSIAAVLAVSCGGGGDDPVGDAVAVPTPTEPPAEEPAESPMPEPTEEATETTPTPFPDPPLEEPEFEDVSLLRCIDVECSRVHEVKLAEQQVLPPLTAMPGVPVVERSKALLRPDGRPLVLLDWFTPHVEDDLWDQDLILYSCVDVACSAVTEQLVLQGHNAWSAAMLPDGSLAISYQTGRPELCSPVDGCVDPDRFDLSSLELLLCPDPENCSPVTGRIIVVDRQGAVGFQGGQVLVGPDGAPAALYVRSVGGPGVAEARLARCSDTRCSDVSITTVLEPERRNLGPAILLAEGAPVFIDLRDFDDARQDFRLIACQDAACSQWEDFTLETPAFGLGAPAFGLGALDDGGLFVPFFLTTGDLGGEGDEFLGVGLSVLLCADPACGSSTESSILAEFPDLFPGANLEPEVDPALTPDGRPWFTARIGAGEIPVEKGGGELVVYVVCDDPACGSATAVQVNDPALFTDAWEPGAAPGPLVHVLNGTLG